MRETWESFIYRGRYDSHTQTHIQTDMRRDLLVDPCNRVDIELAELLDRLYLEKPDRPVSYTYSYQHLSYETHIADPYYYLSLSPLRVRWQRSRYRYEKRHWIYSATTARQIPTTKLQILLNTVSDWSLWGSDFSLSHSAVSERVEYSKQVLSPHR